MWKRLFGEKEKTNSAESETVNKTEKRHLTRADLEVLSRIHTDTEFLQAHFHLMDKIHQPEGHHISHVPILEASFIEKSAQAYPAAWAGRELIQNWVDAEVIDKDGRVKKNKGTLDGVVFKEEDISDGYTRFTISGDWALTNLDGLVGLSSSKPEGQTAGGNGIGLKQTALRFLRDAEFGVRAFNIYATSNQTDTPVKISYDMVTPKDVEDQYATHNTSPIRNIKKPWLMGTIEDTDALTVDAALPEHRKSRDACAYIIETNDKKTIELLRGIKDFGVSSENPHLKDPDFESQKGTVKWTEDRHEKGKLFLNGQMMDYKDKTTDNLPYPGPEGITIRLNNVEYPMSIDRPPINFIDLGKYTDALFEDESQMVLVGQLKVSEHLWHISSKDRDVANANFRSSTSDGYNVAISSIIKGLLPRPYSFSKKTEERDLYTYDNFKADFGENYVYADSYGTKNEEIIEAEKRGYRVCLHEFSKLGVPSIKSVIDSSVRLKEQRPSDDMFEYGQKNRFNVGSRVFYEKFDAVNMDTARGEFFSRLPNTPRHIYVEGNTVKIIFDVPAGEALLIDDLTERNEKDSIENVIYTCRGMIANGLCMKGIDPASPYMLIDGRVVTFSLIEKLGSKSGLVLVARIPEFKTIKQSEKDQIVLEFSLTDGTQAERWKEGDTNPEIQSIEQRESRIVLPDALKKKSLAESDAVDPDQTRKLLHEKVSLVPTSNPEDTNLVNSPLEVIYVPVSLSNEAVAKFEKIKNEIPNLEGIVKKLEEIVESEVPESLSAREKLMLQWLAQKENHTPSLMPGAEKGAVEEGTNDTQLSTLYLKPETFVLSLAHLLELNNQANIPVSLPISGDVKTDEIVAEASNLGMMGERVGAIAAKFIPDAEDLENFELVVSPSPEQLKKLTLLKSVMLAVGYEANNDLFVFKGNNVKGFNLDQKAIGLHESVLNVGFQEAFAVFRHEIAHNRVMDHGAEFIATDEAIAAHIITTMGTAAKRLLDVQLSLMRQGMTADQIESEIAVQHTREFLILNAQDMWDEMTRKEGVVENT